MPIVDDFAKELRRRSTPCATWHKVDLHNHSPASGAGNFAMPSKWRASLAWARQPGNALFLALLLWHLVPVWAFRYFPSQDGGEHVNNANILLRYFTSDGALFREYFIFNRNLDPNWLGHVILASV